jgi:hypothetical protein
MVNGSKAKCFQIGKHLVSGIQCKVIIEFFIPGHKQLKCKPFLSSCLSSGYPIIFRNIIDDICICNKSKPRRERGQTQANSSLGLYSKPKPVVRNAGEKKPEIRIGSS